MLLLQAINGPYMGYQIAAIWITSSVLEGRLFTASLFKWDLYTTRRGGGL